MPYKVNMADAISMGDLLIDQVVADGRLTRSDSLGLDESILTGEYPPMPWIPEGGTLRMLVTDTWILRDGRWQVIARHARNTGPAVPPSSPAVPADASSSTAPAPPGVGKKSWP